MANSFKILDGVNYIAKTGAAGAAGTMEAPKLLSTTAFVVGKNVLGAGSYIWPVGFSAPSGCNIFADGFVKILGDGNTLQQTFGNVQTFDVYFEQWAGMSFTGASSFTRCIFDIISLVNANCLLTNSGNFYSCIFSNVSLIANVNPISMNGCLFLNTQFVIGNSFTIFNCYLDPTTGISTGGSATFNNCNVDSATVIGTNRGIKFGANAWTNGVGQAGSTNGISQAPQFNGAARFDFTLNANSPHVALGIGPTNLGVATSFTLTSSVATGGTLTAANSSVTSTLGGAAVPILSFLAGGDNFQTNTQGGWALVPVAGGTFKSAFTTGVLTINPNGPVELTSLNFIGALNINTDFIATDPFVPQLQNNNVPDYNNGTAGAADRKPNRMTLRMRWSTLANPDVTIASHWLSGMTLVEMEWFAKPTYNLAGYVGNGDVAYNPSLALPVLARTVQIEHTVRNNYGA